MRPASPQVIKDRIAFYAQSEGSLVSVGIRGAILGILNELCGGDDHRHFVFFYLFGQPSSKRLTNAQWYGLLQWVVPSKDEGTGGWLGHESLTAEIASILHGIKGYDEIQAVSGASEGIQTASEQTSF